MALTINQTKTEGITKLGLFPFANNIFAETRKKAVKEKNWDDYVFYHSMWHGVGAGIICPISTWLADY